MCGTLKKNERNYHVGCEPPEPINPKRDGWNRCNVQPWLLAHVIHFVDTHNSHKTMLCASRRTTSVSLHT